jgi:nucleoside phosphorylase
MTGILLATKTEAYFLLKHLSPVKKEGIYHYRGRIAGKNSALYLTRPGVPAREQLRRFLRLYAFDGIISTGACGNLTSELKNGDRVRVSLATAPGKKTISLANHGRPCVSVQHLVTEDKVKADLRLQTRADIIDMETYAIASVMAEKEFARIRFSATRIVDDLPGEENYLIKEKMLREMTALSPSGKLRWRDITRFGLWDYWRITLRRHRIARLIYRAVAAQVAESGN